MWKLSVLKNLSLAHIALLTVSIFVLSGCAALTSQKTKTGEVFYPEYYAAKRLENADVIKLRSYMASTDNKTSAPAGLILGINYLRYGDKNFGRMLIDKNYASPDLDPQMAIFGKLWKVEALISENKIDEAKNIRNEINALERDSLYLRTMKIYCVNSGVTLKGSEDPIVCLDKRIEFPEDIAPTISSELESIDVMNQTPMGSMSYDEYIAAAGDNTTGEIVMETEFDENAEIDVVGGDVMSNMVQGMIYAIGDLQTSFTINSVASEDEAKTNNAVVVLTDKNEVHIGDNAVSLAVDWNKLIEETYLINDIRKSDYIVICASNNTISYAKQLSQMYSSESELSDKNIQVLNYQNPAFQSQLRSYLEKTEIKPKDKNAKPEYSPVSIIGIGSQEDILQFIPIAKYLQNSQNQKITLVVSSFSGNVLKGEYGQYFKNTRIFTPIQLVNNSRFDFINSGYEAYFGYPMNLANVLGYDSVVYLASLLDSGKGDLYLSLTEGFIDGNAYRTAKLYNIGRTLKVTETFYEKITLPETVESVVSE